MVRAAPFDPYRQEELLPGADVETDAELDAFVYKASHDLKGPLASIIGLANVAISEVEDPKAKQYFDLIGKSTLRLDNILMELIDVTRMKETVVRGEAVDLARLVENVREGLQHHRSSQSVRFEQDIHLSRPLISDRKLLHSVLQNLIVNSILYQREEVDSWVKVRAYTDQHYTMIEVSDNGQGIPLKLQQRVFEMFFRGHNDSKGSGLGLYIVQQVVKNLKGTLDVESQEGKFTRFLLSLPNHLSEKEEEEPST